MPIIFFRFESILSFSTLVASKVIIERLLYKLAAYQISHLGPALNLGSKQQWLTLAAKGQPLFLGLDNKPESSFASRIPEVAKKYVGDYCKKSPPNTVDVLLVLNQRGGVSIETILSIDEEFKPIIISKNQRFKLVEIYKTARDQQLVIKLEEI